MELLEFKERFLALSGVKALEDLRITIMERVTTCDADFYGKYLEMVDNDLETDYMQALYQYYLADRDEKKQDFTPKSLGKLISELGVTDTRLTVLDLCSGSGALSIQLWSKNNGLLFTCVELDDGVIPFLLFNLCIRNIDADVLVGDALAWEFSKVYAVRSKLGGKFSTVEEAHESPAFNQSFDLCVSNPPYNIKWRHPAFAQLDPRFSDFGVPHESNANFAFLLTAHSMARRTLMILPNSVCDPSTKDERNILQKLAEEKSVKAIISCPERMFESTQIPVSIIHLERYGIHSPSLIDASTIASKEIREQRGQYGGSSHTGRVYKKAVNILSDDAITRIVKAVTGEQIDKKICGRPTLADVETNNWSLTPKRYIDLETVSKHRDIDDIVSDYNRNANLKNACKLTINESLAKQLGILELKDMQELGLKPVNDLLARYGADPLIEADYIRFTKNKNEIIFSNNNKEMISPIFSLIWSSYRQMVFTCNLEENRIAAELRDALAYKLLTGEWSTDTEKSC